MHQGTCAGDLLTMMTEGNDVGIRLGVLSIVDEVERAMVINAIGRPEALAKAEIEVE